MGVTSLWRHNSWRVLVLALTPLLILIVWWWSLTPSHDRVWEDDVARLLRAEVTGDTVTLHNVRDFDWRSETDFTPHWRTETYDLRELVSADLVLSYWMGPAIAHTLVSFGFEDGRHLVFSLEIRKELGESFSALAGFFRNYDAVLIAAHENDILRVRTNVRDETVRLYALNLEREALVPAFLGYVREAMAIREEPRFYNTLTSNCTTIVLDLAREISEYLPTDYRLLLSGYLAQYAHDHGALVPDHDFVELEAAADITARAKAFNGSPNMFSRAIRQGVPTHHAVSASAP